MRRNKFYQNANTFYYRDKFYINDEPQPIEEKPKIVIDIFEKKNPPSLTEIETNIINEFHKQFPLDPLIIELSKIKPKTVQPSTECKCPKQNTTPCPKLQCPKQQQMKSQSPENLSDPKTWGPKLWFSFHNGAAKYPSNPSPIIKNNMKNFILGIPVILPCEKCKEHANQFIESNYNNLDKIVSSRDNLFKFFFDFHNHVNRNTNKPEMSYEDAKKLYNF